jgi:Tfp pilus assembly protein PilO
MSGLIKEKYAAGAVAGVALVFFLALLRPATSDLKIARKDYQEIRSQVAQRRLAVEQLTAQETGKRLVAEENVSAAIDELTNEGIARGVKFVAITPMPVQKSKDQRYRILPIEVDVESDYEHLGNFLGSLEALKNGLVTVKSFMIVPEEKTPAQLNTKLIIDMYLDGA